jgi:hypothetical protein
MNWPLVSALLLAAGAVCFVVGALINLALLLQ